MKKFEMFGKNSGEKKFKIVLHEIFSDEVVDDEKKVGTKWNKNGITWIRSYCEAQLESIKGKSLRCEFIDDERTEIAGHGETGIEDDIPLFEDATVIGHFTNGYIDEIESDGRKITACIAEGTIDSMCYHKFVKRLEKELSEGYTVHGSVEIMHKEDEKSIGYLYGYVPEGRIPVSFDYSGYALLGIEPADDEARIIELNKNQKEENPKMNENEIKTIVSQVLAEQMSANTEINNAKEECAAKIAEANELVAAATTEKEEAVANSAKIQAALDECRKELDEKYAELEVLHQEMHVLREELSKMKAKERIGELNAAISKFSEEEKSYAKEEMDAFNADPINSEINSVVNKIYEGIGKASKDSQVVETNSAANTDIDIFAEVCIQTPEIEDTNIF